MAVSASAKEEKPTKFEKITIEFNTIYNELLASVRDRDTKASQERYLKLYNIYMKLKEENLSKAEKEIIEKRIMDASGIVPSDRPYINLKNKKI